MTGVSNYPNGFSHGVTIRGVPVEVPPAGKVFWVNNSSALVPGGVGGSDGNPGTYQKPFSTLDYAVGQCTANRGDVIYVMPGHAENVTTAAGIDVDVAGVQIIGLGKGSLRPTFTWSGTDSTATFELGAAGVSISNLLFIQSDAGDDVAAMIDITADDVEVGYCELRDDDNQALVYIRVNDGVDRVHIHDTTILSDTDNGDAGISFTGASTAASGHVVERCFIHGDFDLGCIDLVSDTNAITDIKFTENQLTNLASGQHAIDMDSDGGATNVTGVIADNVVSTNSSATALYGGGATVVRNQYGTGDVSTPVGAGARYVAVKSGLTFDDTEQLMFEVVNGPVVIDSMVLAITTEAENAETSVFDNISTDVTGTLYASAQELVVDSADAEVTDLIVLGAGSASVQEGDVTDPGTTLGWTLVSGDNAVWDGVATTTATGVGDLIITYTSLGGTIEIE